LVALAAGPGNHGRAADEPSGTGRTVPFHKETLERFAKMSAEERLKLVEKAAGGGQAFVPVTRDDLTTGIIERGTVEAVDATDIVCRVKAKDRKDNVATTIKWVVEDGTRVKKGQLLATLDDSALQDQLRMQDITVAQATADKDNADEELKIAIKQIELDIRRAEINLKLAQLNLKKFTGKDADEKEILALKVAQAEVNLETVKFQSRAKEGAARTLVKVKTATEAQELAKKRDLEAQVAACVLKAPQAGLLVYVVPETARWGGNTPTVAVGEPVREGQKLMSVCGLEHFAVTCRVHEALIAQVRAGQTVTVRVDAFPRRPLAARVKAVSNVATKQDFLTADVKTYPVLLEITERFAGLKPGMSSTVHIQVQHLRKVLHVPVGSLLRSGRGTFCYVKVGKGLQPRPVKTGARNDFFVEIKDGLEEGDKVLWGWHGVAAYLTGLAFEDPKEPADKRSSRPTPPRVLVRSVPPLSPSETSRRVRILSFGLTYQDLARIQTLPGVAEVVPVRSFPVEARRLARMSRARLVATVPAYPELAGIRLAGGRFLDDEDDVRMKNVAVLGADVARTLFPEEDPVGGVVRLGRACTSFVVVGVLAEVDQRPNGREADEVNEAIYVPLRTCRARFGERIIDRRAGSFRMEAVALNEILVAARTPRHARFVGDCIAALLQESHVRKDWEVEAGHGE
jgi:multidrug efflux pump subunit AcrA (membrane-fusion protein)